MWRDRWHGGRSHDIRPLTCNSVRIQALPPHQPCICRGLNISLEPSSLHLVEGYLQQNLFEPPRRGLHHFALDMSHKKRSLVHPHFPYYQVLVPSLGLHAQEVTGMTIQDCLGNVVEVVVGFCECAGLLFSRSSRFLHLVVQNTSYNLLPTSAAGLVFNSIVFARRWPEVHCCKHMRVGRGVVSAEQTVFAKHLVRSLRRKVRLGSLHALDYGGERRLIRHPLVYALGR